MSQLGPRNQEQAHPAASGVRAPASFFRRLLDWGVNLAVFAALAGVFYLGWRNDWKLDRLLGKATAEEEKKDDWCEKHRVPEAVCVECHPDLAPRVPDSGWCAVHGISNCPFEHPEVCRLATPHAFSSAEREQAARALAGTQQPANNPACTLYQRRIQLASEEVAKKCGIETALVKTGPLVEGLEVHGELSYDLTRLARLSSRVAGTLWNVRTQVGAKVRKGDVLALVEAAEVGRAKGEFLQAYAQSELKNKNWEAIRAFASTGAIPERDQREAETAAADARIRLKSAQQALMNLGLPVNLEDLRGLNAAALERRVHFLGLPADLISQLDQQTTPFNLLPVISPQDGSVTASQAVRGEVVDTTRMLFTIAILDPLWLMLEVRFEDVGRLHPGQLVSFEPDGSKTSSVGRITWISSEADDKTRTVKVRAQIDNKDHKLLAHAFGHGEVILREEPKAVLVPSDAVQWEGCCHIVFVEDRRAAAKDKGRLLVYQVRQVRPGIRTGGQTEIIAGLCPGETVVTKGSGVLKGELLKHKIGAAD